MTAARRSHQAPASARIPLRLRRTARPVRRMYHCRSPGKAENTRCLNCAGPFARLRFIRGYRVVCNPGRQQEQSEFRGLGGTHQQAITTQHHARFRRLEFVSLKSHHRTLPKGPPLRCPANEPQGADPRVSIEIGGIPLASPFSAFLEQTGPIEEFIDWNAETLQGSHDRPFRHVIFFLAERGTKRFAEGADRRGEPANPRRRADFLLAVLETADNAIEAIRRPIEGSCPGTLRFHGPESDVPTGFEELFRQAWECGENFECSLAPLWALIFPPESVLGCEARLQLRRLGEEFRTFGEVWPGCLGGPPERRTPHLIRSRQLPMVSGGIPPASSTAANSRKPRGMPRS